MARGLGVEFGNYRGGDWFDLMGKVRFLRASGTTMLDGYSESTEFTLVSGEAVLGVRMHLLPGEFDWFAPYVGAAGVLGFQFLRLAEIQMRGMTTNLANLSMLPLGGFGLVFGLSW
jgi:hypothetical protein